LVKKPPVSVLVAAYACIHVSIRDLGITIYLDLSPTLHINDIVAKAHKGALAHICSTRC